MGLMNPAWPGPVVSRRSAPLHAGAQWRMVASRGNGWILGCHAPCPMPHHAACQPCSGDERCRGRARGSPTKPAQAPDSLTAAHWIPPRLPRQIATRRPINMHDCIDAPHTARAQRRFQAWSESRQAGPRQQFVAPFGLAWPAGAGGVPSPLSLLAATDTGMATWMLQQRHREIPVFCRFLPLSAIVRHRLARHQPASGPPTEPGNRSDRFAFFISILALLSVGTAACRQPRDECRRPADDAVAQLSSQYGVHTQYAVYSVFTSVQLTAALCGAHAGRSPFSVFRVALLCSFCQPSVPSVGRAGGRRAVPLNTRPCSVRHSRDRP